MTANLYVQAVPTHTMEENRNLHLATLQDYRKHAGSIRHLTYTVLQFSFFFFSTIRTQNDGDKDDITYKLSADF